MSNPTNLNPAALAALGNLFQSLAQGAPAPAPVSPGCARLTYGTESIEVDAMDLPNVASAFAANAGALGLDLGRAATYTKDGVVISGNAGLTEGATYVATVKHDDKG